MTNHLPECPTVTAPHGVDMDCDCECLCEILRACEERVRDEERFRCLTMSENRSRWREEGVAAGHEEGLRAARKAVAAYLDRFIVDDAAGGLLAAIDALKEGK